VAKWPSEILTSGRVTVRHPDG